MQGVRPTRTDQAQALGLSDRLWELVQMCWQQDRSQRPAAPFVLERLEAILYSGAPAPAVGFKSRIDRTYIEGSESSESRKHLSIATADILKFLPVSSEPIKTSGAPRQDAQKSEHLDPANVS